MQFCDKELKYIVNMNNDRNFLLLCLWIMTDCISLPDSANKNQIVPIRKIIRSNKKKVENAKMLISSRRNRLNKFQVFIWRKKSCFISQEINVFFPLSKTLVADRGKCLIERRFLLSVEDRLMHSFCLLNTMHIA
jgi:hypothetical protein